MNLKTSADKETEGDTLKNPKTAKTAEKLSRGVTIWLTGLSGAGKSTICESLAPLLREKYKRNVEVLDGDEVRTNLSKGLGFSKEDRDINIRRIGFVAKLLSRNGVFTITAAISPYADVREECRKMTGDFLEVFIDCPIDVLKDRDPKGLYAKALSGEIKNFTGISDPYESPINPEVHIRTDKESVEESVEKIIRSLKEKGYLNS